LVALPQELRFLLAGAYNTVFGYLTFALLFILLQNRIHYLFIVLLCQPVCLASAFIVHRNSCSSRRTLAAELHSIQSQSTCRFRVWVAGLYSLVRFGHLAPLLLKAWS